MSEKKNQHYIPKFYLRYFSYQNNKKQIGVFNVENSIFIQKAKLKTQGSKDFFYCRDGVVEDELGKIEVILSQTIGDIINTRQVPKRNSERHRELLLFVTLTDSRNPVKVEGLKTHMSEVKKKLLELFTKVNVDKLVPSPTHEETIKLLLSNSIEMTNYISDLEYKLLINKSNKPFVSSDFPIVKYNQFLEKAKWPLSKSGYGTVGLQIFIPLNSELALVLFDAGIYKVGDKKKKHLELNNSTDIDAINTLQFNNCFKTIFFDEKANEEYIRNIEANSRKFRRANITHLTMSHMITTEENVNQILKGNDNLMVLGSTECEMKLQISGIRIHNKGKKYIFNSSAAQLRKHCIMTDLLHE